MQFENATLSKAVSHALRHEPWLYELELDDEGWASVKMLVAGLRQANPDWADLSCDALVDVVTSSDKQRHETAGDRIRALYGHSVGGKLRRQAAPPPSELFHGTSSQAAALIEIEGLKPMGRQYVHLSVDEVTALTVGRRKSNAPMIWVQIPVFIKRPRVVAEVSHHVFERGRAELRA